VGPLILEYYERHYDLPYPLPKMDLVAVPDFSAGAMENWGLITFRETALLFKKGGSAISDREQGPILQNSISAEKFNVKFYLIKTDKISSKN
jgi:hypothetical protein